jgi:hypothetical protein
MKKRKTLKYALLALAVIAIAGAIYTYKEYNRKQLDVANILPKYTIGYNALLNEFIADEKNANAKYLDKVLEINAPVKSVDKDDKGFYTVVLGDSSSMSSIRCSMDSVHNNEAAKLIIGSTIHAKGMCTGFNADEMLGSDVILNRCTIKNN